MKSVLILGILLSGCASRAKYATTESAPAPSVLTTRGAVAREEAGYQMSGESLSLHSLQRGRTLTALPGAAADAVASVFGGGAGPSAPATAQVIQSPVAPEKLVVESWIELRTDDVAKTAAAVAARVEAEGGRVVSSNIVGAERAASSAALELRVPPEKVIGFSSWLSAQGEIESRRTLASDVGKQMFDQQLALQNLELTMSRLQKLVQSDVPVKELLEIERELTRVRGEIERVKGEQRWLADRVQLATVTLTLRREGGPVAAVYGRPRLFPGARFAMLRLLDAGGRPETRTGGGAMLRVNRHFTLDFDIFPRKDGDSRAALATLGTALYSGLLGGGNRRFFNPYLGLRAGYGYLSGEGSAVVAGEIGIELFKHRYLLVEVAGRAIAFLREDSEGALQGVAGVAVPF